MRRWLSPFPNRFVANAASAPLVLSIFIPLS
ncbi:MAG: hypothetical protein ACP5I1_10365, partial [Candidatus Hinthialibacter sp.]